MAKRLNYQVGFSADTSELKTALTDVQNSLKQISTLSTGAPLTQDMRTAAVAAQQLSTYLREATNANTGNLDLSKFNASLQAGKISLQDYANRLQAIGPAGEKAFLDLASAISKAELPVARTSKLLDNLWITMKNTMRWQLTSSALHGFVGAVQTAYGYTKDLNRSLNSIQIVTSKSTEDMGKFAEQANKAAKALSTTTTDYTDASLIYYQQGLDDQAVIGRTNTTIKLANVARESAEEASEQMTAIWNNFYDGSKSLEYYADVMTALGASTASSTQEISEGLQKFAAVANTVGLSYEYAASALATITATTRESANIVGTSLRTLFARIQGLMQDETQDDGTTLNKYSKALARVGVDIKDVSGEMKTMNTILDELGAKWSTLEKDQKMALAQTVAGVRQYTQLIALMDNWDFFQENLTTAMGSEGALEKQAQIYAKSWEAARDRVRAAAEDIYDSVINPEMFIDMDNSFTPVLSGIADIIDGLGGLKGIMTAVGYGFTTLYGEKMAQGLRDMAYNVSLLTGKEMEHQRAVKATVAALAEQMTMDSANLSERNMSETQIQAQKVGLQIQLNERAKELSTIQYEQLQNEINLTEAIGQASLAYAEQAQQAQLVSNELINDLILSDKVSLQLGEQSAINLANSFKTAWIQQTKGLDLAKLMGIEKSFANLNFEDFNLENLITGFRELARQQGVLEAIRQQLKGIDTTSADAGIKVKQLMKDLTSVTGQNTNGIENVNVALEKVKEASTKASEGVRIFKDGLSQFGAPNIILDQVSTSMQQVGLNAQSSKSSIDLYKESIAQLETQIKSAQTALNSWADIVIGVGRQITSLAMMSQSIKTFANVFTNDSLSGGEKFLQILTSLGMLIPTIATLTKGLTGQFYKNAQAILAKVQADTASTTVEQLSISSKEKLILRLVGVKTAVDNTTGAVTRNTVAWMASPITKITAGLTALIAVITIVTQVLQKQKEAQHELNVSQMEAADAAKAEIEANQDLIDQMQEALELYQDTGENKDDLDEKCQELASAYGVEGSAIAKLTGEYDDYNAVLQESIEKHEAAIKAALNSAEIGQRAAGKEMLEAARTGNGVAFGDNYSVGFSGSGAEEKQAIDILKQFVSSDFISHSYQPQGKRGGTHSGLSSIDFSVDKTNYNDMVQLYDQMVQARDEMEGAMSKEALEDVDVYQKLVTWIDKMAESVEKYRGYMEEAAKLSAQLGELSDQSVSDISSLDEYRNWVEQVTKSLEEKRTGIEDINAIIEAAVQDSPNPDVQKFKDIYDAIAEVKKVANDKLYDDTIETAFNSDIFDPAISATLDWANITSGSFLKAYVAAAKYTKALSGTTDAVEDLSSAQEALSILSDDMDLGDYQQLLNMIDWSSAESGISGFTEFLSLSLQEQETLIKQMVVQHQREIIQEQGDLVVAASEQAAQASEQLEAIGEDAYNKASDNIAKWERLQALLNQYEQSKGNETPFSSDKTDEANLLAHELGLIEENQHLFVEIGGKSAENYMSGFAQGMANDQQIVDSFNGLQSTIEAKIQEAKEAIQNINLQIEMEAKFGLEESGGDITELIQMMQEGQISAEAFTKAQLDLQDTLDEDIDVEEYEDFAKYLENNSDALGEMGEGLTDTKKQCENTAKSIMRFDSALEDVQDHYDDWLAQLESGSVQDAAKAIEELSNAYGDLLNIDGNLLSDEFLSSKDNLDLFRQAAEGSEDAYDSLAAAAQEDIIAHCVFEADRADFESNLAYVMERLSEVDGTTITFESLLNDAPFISALNSMLAATGGNVQAISGLLQGLGYNITFKESEPEMVDVTEVGSYWDPPQYSTNTLETGGEENPGSSFTELVMTKPGGWRTETTTSTQLQRPAGAAVEVESLGKAAGGGIKYANAPHGGGSKGGRGGRGGGGGGKGGSSEGTKYKPKEPKKRSDVVDRYHEITREIKRQEGILDDIGEANDRVFGVDKIKNFRKELINLTKQEENYNKKLAEAEDWLKKDAAAMQERFGNEAIIDENGEIANFTELQEKKLEEYNKYVEEYNAKLAEWSTWTKDQQEAQKDMIEAAEEEYEQKGKTFEEDMKALEQYEETRDVVYEMRDALEETRRAIADNKLSQVEYRLEVVLDVKSMKDDLNDLAKTIAESFGDALTYGAEKAKLTAESTQNNIDLLPELKNQYASLVALYNSPDEYMNRDQIMSDIQDLFGETISAAEALIDDWEEMEEMIPELLDAAAERYALFTDQLEHNTTVVDTIKELYTLQGVTYKTMDGFNKLQRVSQEKLEAQVVQARIERRRYDQMKDLLAEAQSKLDSLGGDESDPMYDTYKKARDAALEQFNEAEEAYLSLAQSAMETAQEMYMEQIEKAVHDFGQVVSNGVGLDLLQDKYDHYIEKNERYFDKVQEAYHTTAWFNKLQEDIDKATNSAQKDRLKALQDEVNIRRKNNQLSQYDLDILNAKYEVLQAQMALEDAQNAKNNLQLVRDRQGNWNYQYTADPTAVENAEQDLLDAQNNWYEIAKQQVTDVTGEIVSAWSECQEQIRDIYQDMTLTDQERSDRAAEIYAYYTEKIKFLEQEKQVSIQDMTEAGNATLFATSVMMGDQLTDLTGVTSEDIKNVVAQGGENVIGLLTADNETIKNIIASNTELIDLFDNTYAEDLDNMTQNSANFESALRATLAQAERDFQNYQDKVASVAAEVGVREDQLVDKTNEVSNATDQLSERAEIAAVAIDGMIQEALEAIDVYDSMADSIWAAVEALRAFAAEQLGFTSSKTDLENSAWKNYNKDVDYSAMLEEGIFLGAIQRGDTTYNTLMEQRAMKRAGENMTVDQYKLTEKQLADKLLDVGLNEAATDADRLAFLDKLKNLIPGFDTGGYTGEFTDAKLAFVHQKELILNPEDTNNILSAVNATKQMGTAIAAVEKMLDNNVMAVFSLMAERLNGISVSPVHDTLEQNVHVEATFPNVTSSDEIVEAFNTITNDAAQWARRRKD